MHAVHRHTCRQNNIQEQIHFKKSFRRTELLTIIKITSKCNISTKWQAKYIFGLHCSPLKPTYAAYEENCKASDTQCSRCLHIIVYSTSDAASVPMP